MIFAMMILTCFLWGFICRDINASMTTLLFGGFLIGIIFHYIEKMV